MKEFLQKVLSFNYWFHLDRIDFQFSDFVFLTLGAILLIAFFVIRSYKAEKVKDRDEKKVWSRVNRVLFWIGGSLVVWFGFRYQLVGFLGTRFVALAIVITGIAWGYYIKSWYEKEHITGIEKRKAQEARNKYINA